ALSGLIDFWIPRRLIFSEIMCDVIEVFHGSGLMRVTLHPQGESGKERKTAAMAYINYLIFALACCPKHCAATRSRVQTRSCLVWCRPQRIFVEARSIGCSRIRRRKLLHR